MMPTRTNAARATASAVGAEVALALMTPSSGHQQNVIAAVGDRREGVFAELVDQDRGPLLQVPPTEAIVVGDRVVEVERVVDSPRQAVAGFEVGVVVGGPDGNVEAGPRARDGGVDDQRTGAATCRSSPSGVRRVAAASRTPS